MAYRKMFGEVAFEKGFITSEQLYEALAIQAKRFKVKVGDISDYPSLDEEKLAARGFSQTKFFASRTFSRRIVSWRWERGGSERGSRICGSQPVK